MDIFVNNEVGEREGSFKSVHGNTVEEVLETLPGAGFLVDWDGAIVNAKRMVLPPGTYTYKFKKTRDGVKSSDLLKFVGILVERTSGGNEAKLNGATSTTEGIVTVLHSLGSYKTLKEEEHSTWDLTHIPDAVSYLYRDPVGAKADVPLQPYRFDCKRDIIVFTPAVPQPQAKISLRDPMLDDDRRVYFIHWSPASSVMSGLIQDEGVIVGESTELKGQYLASLRAHAGSCGGGVFFKFNGELVGIHQGAEHESEETPGGMESMEVDVQRKEFELLKQQKDAYTYFLGSAEIKEVTKST